MNFSGICCLVTFTILAASAADRPRLHPLVSQSRNATTGPSLGTHIPDFEATDTHDRHRTFESLRGPKGLVLVVDRSADWCPSCKAQLIDLNQQVDGFEHLGLHVAALTYDSVAVLRHFAERKAIRYTLLSDPESKAIRAFGLLNNNIDPSSPAYGIAFPGIYIIDERGIVQAKYFEDDNTERYSAAAILTHEFGADGIEKNTVETPQLTVASSATDATFAPGQRITLILEIDAKPGMHVYAPGVEGGYMAIDWQTATTKSWIAWPISYPQARIRRLPVINDAVPVYSGHFRLVRDITIGQEAEIAPLVKPDRTLILDGAFRYQACDDRECYPPRVVPLQWTFHLSRRDTERVPPELQRKVG